MNVVDSSGWLEYFAKGPNALFFAPVIRNTKELIVPTISVYEVYKRVLQQRGEQDAYDVVASMTQAYVVELSQILAIHAAQLSHHHKIPMADSMILATAYAYQATLWTQDAHLKDLPSVQYIAKPTIGG